MTDALRFDKSSASGDAPDRERDARIEELLLTGLDHYFAGQHELAINIWTRVLFLDRGHAKARAYIERARGAIAERQREADELFHTGAAALRRGDRTAARALLTSAVERGASGEEALALLHRLDRLEAAGTPRQPVPPPAAARTRSAAMPGAADRRGIRGIAWVAGGILAGILIAGSVGAYVWMTADPLEIGAPQAVLPQMPEDPLPVPAAAEIRLTRAQDFFAKGRVREAARHARGVRRSGRSPSRGIRCLARDDPARAPGGRKEGGSGAAGPARIPVASMRCPKCQYISFDNGDRCRNAATSSR